MSDTSRLIEAMAVDIHEAARLASVSASTIRRAISAGKLRAAKLGASVRIRPADLDAWLVASASTGAESK